MLYQILGRRNKKLKRENDFSNSYYLYFIFWEFYLLFQLIFKDYTCLIYVCISLLDFVNINLNSHFTWFFFFVIMIFYTLHPLKIIQINIFSTYVEKNHSTHQIKNKHSGHQQPWWPTIKRETCKNKNTKFSININQKIKIKNAL